MSGIRRRCRAGARMVLASIICTTLAGCGDSRSDYEKTQDKIESEYQASRTAATSNAVADLNRQDREWESSKGPAPHGLAACKASIGVLMSQEPRIMTGRILGENRFSVSYRREDGTRWEYRCEARPNRLRWTLFENGREGRQRQEDDIRYSVKGNVLSLMMRGVDGKDYSWRFGLPAVREIES